MNARYTSSLENHKKGIRRPETNKMEDSEKKQQMPKERILASEPFGIGINVNKISVD